MNKKNNRNIKKFYNLILIVAFLAALSGCNSTDKSQTNANQAVITPTPQTTQAVPAATPDNPTLAFAGAWETTYDMSKIMPGYPSASTGAVGQFAQWRLSEGVKKGDEYVGKVTNEGNNENIAEYTVAGKTITLKFLPVAGMQNTGATQTSGTSRDYEYEISNNGNTLTLKGRDPIVLQKGSGNSDMETVSFIISNKVDWTLSPPRSIDPNKPDAYYITFDTAQKFDNGYGGKMEFWNEDPNNPNAPHTVVATGQYLLTSKDNVTITLGGPKSATYKLIDNRVLQIDFTDPNEKDMVLTAR